MSSYPLLSTKNGRTWDISSNIINTTGAITCNGGAQTGTFYSNNVSAIRVPSGPSSARPPGLQGYLRYDVDNDISSNFLEYYDSLANAWIPLAPSPIVKSVTPNFVTDTSGSSGYYNTYPLLISGGNFLPGSTVSYRDPSGIITSAPTTYYYSGLQLGATVPSAVYNPVPYKSPFSIIVTNPGNYIGILNNAITAANSRTLSVSGLTGGSYSVRYLSTLSGTTDTSSNTTPYQNGSTLYTFTTTDASLSTSLFSVTPNFTGTIEYLVVAGGGAGSDDGDTIPGNGGGGAGGYLAGPISVSNGVSYSVQVGGGAPGVTGKSSQPTAGLSSTFASLTSAGGGRGGYHNAQPGGNGGSGGGGGSSTTTASAGGTATPGQGRDGGRGADSSKGGGGGGGGAGAVGADGSSSAGGRGGDGGAGSQNAISGANLYYAGGGGGSPGGTGGLGGGGNAASSSGGNGGNGTRGTGGGGGASVAGTPTPIVNVSGSGGSGIVILRFASFS